MKEPEKLIDSDGDVAVLYSPGYGAGWSTWAHEDELAEFLMFDKELVLMADRNAPESVVKRYIKEAGYDYVYMGGWGQIKVRWIPKGESFVIKEYDGSESFRGTESLVHTA